MERVGGTSSGLAAPSTPVSVSTLPIMAICSPIAQGLQPLT